MDIRLTRRPGQPGTKKFVERYGERLVCVRYRYDAAGNWRTSLLESRGAEEFSRRRDSRGDGYNVP
jgi:hypothetical protein